MFGKFFKKKKAEVTALAVNTENRDKMEAMIGGGLLIAFADGECTDDELLSIDEQINADKTLANFGTEIGENITKFTAMLQSNFRMGKLKIMREITDCTNVKEDAEEILLFVIGIAEADEDGMEPEEMVVIKEIAKALNLNIKDYYDEETAA